jgi:Ca2+-binding RTX toxin-like protein
VAIDTDPPGATITAGPPDGDVITDSTPTFEFNADEPVLRFECKVAPQPYSDCTSPLTLPTLANGGPYRFLVRAVDLAGNVGPAAERSFWVDTNPPTVSVSDVTVAEGDSGTANATLTLSLSRVPNHPVRVDWATRPGTARPSGRADYVTQTGLAQFGSSQTTRTIAVPIVGDRYTEPTESFEVALTDANGATRVGGPGVVTITDVDICTHVIGPEAGVLDGTSGDDVLCGDERDNRINGLEGADKLYGFGGNDTLAPGPGNDLVVGAAPAGVPGPDAAHDFVWYLGGPAVNVNLATGTATGANGTDTITQVEDVHGSPNPDTIIGSDAANELSGNLSDDVVRGGGGPDVLVGNEANDTIFGEAGHDKINGGPGNDTMSGGAGNDELGGNTGTDSADGGPGIDKCFFSSETRISCEES